MSNYKISKITDKVTDGKVENLLKPRYKVIADYPKSKFKVGRVLKCEDMLTEAYIGNPSYSLYPHIFKKLEWWEERELSSFPEYVKLVMDDKIHFVNKVERWNGKNSEGVPIYEYKNKVNYLTVGCALFLDPATKEEYENQNKNL